MNVRRSRLAIGTCPGCSGNTLVSNGAFWRCEVCRYAVTSTALAADRAAAEAVVRHSLQGFRDRFETHTGVEEADLDAIPAGSH
ncbi:MAG: hypothetical protein JSR62_06580 [Nitrospira sp.]|nr:hypothetical protein [Nitrospira sp.]